VSEEVAAVMRHLVTELLVLLVAVGLSGPALAQQPSPDPSAQPPAERERERRGHHGCWCPCSGRVPKLGNALGGLGANMHVFDPESRVSLFGATYRYTSSTHRSSAGLPGHPLAPITIASC
jgi:hypothetical protein